MASAIGIAVISSVLIPMAAKAMEKVKAKVVRKVDGIVNIEREISSLQTTLLMIEGIVQKAEEKQIENVFIQNWLRKLVGIGYDARDVLDDFNLTFPSCDITAEEASNRIYHRNILHTFGTISLEILDKYLWHPSTTISKVLHSICFALEEPEASHAPLVPEIDYLYRCKRFLYEQTAREWTIKYAME